MTDIPDATPQTQVGIYPTHYFQPRIHTYVDDAQVSLGGPGWRIYLSSYADVNRFVAAALEARNAFEEATGRPASPVNDAMAVDAQQEIA